MLPRQPAPRLSSTLLRLFVFFTIIHITTAVSKGHRAERVCIVFQNNGTRGRVWKHGWISSCSDVTADGFSYVLLRFLPGLPNTKQQKKTTHVVKLQLQTRGFLYKKFCESRITTVVYVIYCHRMTCRLAVPPHILC